VLAAEAFSSATFANQAALAVAVSGGSDSTALLLLAHEWAKDRGKTVVATTFDHRLREGSRDEALWVADLCKRIGVPHHILRWEGERPDSGIQAKARQQRYDRLAVFCLGQGIRVLVTGHTMDDQAETVVMRQTRSRSDKSLAGIWPELDWHGLRIVRPLLAFRREELRNYLRTRGQTWIEDPSNLNPRFERVRVRSGLEEADVGGLSTIAEVSQRRVLRTERAAKDWIARHVKEEPEGYFQLERQAISETESDLVGSVLFSLIFCLSSYRQNSTAQREVFVRWMKAPSSGRRTIAGAVVAKQKDWIIVGREPGRILASADVVPGTGELTWDKRIVIRAPSGSVVKAAATIGRRPRIKGVPGFVCDALPAVQLAGGRVCFPWMTQDQGVSMRLIERINGLAEDNKFTMS
jgi:tRNA(Ile)-lysidine synthase